MIVNRRANLGRGGREELLIVKLLPAWLSMLCQVRGSEVFTYDVTLFTH